VPRRVGGETKHGHARTGNQSPEYMAWSNMKDRCLNPKHPQFHVWGGRGITVCDRWFNGKSGFECFLADMGPKPEPKDEYEIDRINPNGIYEPGNCQWATELEAAVNTRRTHRISLPDGRIVARSGFSRLLGLPEMKLNGVLHRAKKRITDGASLQEETTKVGIQVTFWMLLADMLKGPDPPQAARDFARFVSGKDGGRRQ
jgi:hypothetical protein